MPDSAIGSAPAALAIASRCSAIARPDSKPSLAAAAAARSTSGRAIPARSAASGTRSHSARASSSCRSASPGAWRRCDSMPAATDAASARGRSCAPCQWHASSACGARGVGLHRPRQRRVQRGPLARQQILVDRLADERVAERVRAVGVGDEDLVRDRLARAVGDVAGQRPPRAGRGRSAARPRRPRAPPPGRPPAGARSGRAARRAAWPGARRCRRRRPAAPRCRGRCPAPARTGGRPGRDRARRRGCR